MIPKDVSDTALWVAVYRERETLRPDALFRDPYAGKLAGERGRSIEKQMIDSRYVAWSVVIRTCIIDRYIQDKVSQGIDTVINLGAGLDTRPYRMELPSDLNWIEIDFPAMISLKNERLADEKPRCRLQRIALDLSSETERERVFAELGSHAKKVLILTEGVTPYLSNDAVASLARALRNQASFKYWITDYNSPELMKYMLRPSRLKQMKNAPFIFNPANWIDFYETQGWHRSEIRYIGEESDKLGRKPPYSLWIRFLMLISSPDRRKRSKQMNGYAVMEPHQRSNP